MSAEELRAALHNLSLSQNAAARFLEVDARRVRRWASGDEEIPAAVAYLLRVMVRLGLTASYVEGLEN